MSAFVEQERAHQARVLERSFGASVLREEHPWRFLPGQEALNLHPKAMALFGSWFGSPEGPTWHLHRGHGLSSQVCCLNFLAPLADRPDLLALLVETATGESGVEILPVERGLFVTFEWIGAKDYLGEAEGAKARKRGANCTSADGFLRYRAGGVEQALLIEWKYTESYGASLPDHRRTDNKGGNATRMERYQDLAFAPEGPVKADPGLALDHFFWEPFYQLLRQQMLALKMERDLDDPASRVRVLHLSPAGNHALHRVTSPKLTRFGTDALAIHRSLLAQPEDFFPVNIGRAFAPVLDRAEVAGEAEWAGYIRQRYAGCLSE